MDKLLHFLLSYLIALCDPLIALFAGLGKEVWDGLTGLGVASAWDFVADLAGILLALVLS